MQQGTSGKLIRRPRRRPAGSSAVPLLRQGEHGGHRQKFRHRRGRQAAAERVPGVGGVGGHPQPLPSPASRRGGSPMGPGVSPGQARVAPDSSTRRNESREMARAALVEVGDARGSDRARERRLLPGAGVAPRPDPAAPVSGPAPYVEGCQACHAAPVGAHYAQSLHTAKGIRCGQCHTPGGHPNFTQPVRDGKCGGCHQPQYQQTLASKHFATRDAARAGRRPGRAGGAPPGGLHRGHGRAAALRGRLVLGRARRPPVRGVSLRRASPRPRRRAAGGLLRRVPRGAGGALPHPDARLDESLRGVPRPRGRDRERARSSTRIASPGRERRAPDDERASTPSTPTWPAP